jgi:glycosyltransferase involved in cell wall biosynthesis
MDTTRHAGKQRHIMKHESTGDNITPLVSIIICAYNAGKYLRASLVSVLTQTYQNLDIVIIDDGSTDDSFASITDLLTDHRIRVFHQENATRPVALNRALDLIRGDFYAIQDGDDISHPTRIEKQVRAMLNQPQVAAVFCGNELIINDRSMAPTFAAKDIDDCKRSIEAFSMPAHDPTGMFRLSLVRDFRYQQDLQYVEAFDYILRVGERYPMIVLGECLYGYRILWSSVTRRDPARRIKFVAEAMRQACARRGIEYHQASARQAELKSQNSILDNNLAAHFMESVLDQRKIGNYWRAFKIGVECARLHPLDAHYYKALIYAISPLNVVSFIRDQRSRQHKKGHAKALFQRDLI